MPLPTLVLIAFASGIAAAIAARVELRISPRPALLTRAFGAHLLFVGLVLVPISVYFYVFHGDWFLLYLVDVRRVPSAVALLGFIVEAAVAATGFLLGAGLVRNQRDSLAGAAVAGALVLAGGLLLAARDRLAVVGSFAQYRGRFGLEPFGQGPLMQGTLAMGLLLAVGLVFLLVRLHLGGKRL